ncbi:hypothetical protein CSOJ01_10722 [Colletotrichum sojae]|uniref:Uncharacterized protein n=1 Tax=Colletotrichum sojae TaxID=2175907 RepID=A0A8H6MPT6_9PEZI|nr:hypothetical protein CSOJ01_10722 [Colletotrichum sojae]
MTATAASQTCYFPNGQPDPSGIPCPIAGSNAAAACCRRTGHYCLTNGLCLEPNAWTMYRNSCTDPTYQASGCPKFCHESSIEGAATDQHNGVNYCGRGNSWTCNNRANCAKPSGNFTMSPRGRIMLNTAVESDLGILATATSSGPSGTGYSVCTTPSEPGGGGISTGAAAGIGAGIGVPLAIAVGVLTVLLLREKKKARSAQADLVTDAGSAKPLVSAASPGWTQQEHVGGHGQTAGYGQQLPTTELPSTQTVRHELPQ